MDYSAKSLTPIFEEHISTSAKIMTDRWRGYEPLKEIYDIEKYIATMVLIYTITYCNYASHVSKRHIQAYFDDFCFRMNHSQFKTNIFHETINRMIESKPIYQIQIKQIISV